MQLQGQWELQSEFKLAAYETWSQKYQMKQHKTKNKEGAMSLRRLQMMIIRFRDTEFPLLKDVSVLPLGSFQSAIGLLFMWHAFEIDTALGRDSLVW